MTAPARLPLWWRHLLLGGAASGLACSTAVAAPPGWPAISIVSIAALVALRPAAAGAPFAASVWALLCLGAGLLAGTGVGELRQRAIAAGSYGGDPGERASAEGHVAGAPRLSGGELRFPLETGDGRLMVSVDGHPDLGIGDRVRVRGILAAPEPFRAGELERAGAALELRARRVVPRPGARSGLAGALDRARRRAESALAAGLGRERAALARGFVLGQDDRIAPDVREDFRRSGLAHLLAVSGQNVMLLAILGGVALSLVGVGPRARLVLLLALIAAYVPIAGGAASIQRAGIMGGAGILAGLAGRPTDRLHVLLLAAVGTLALNPHSVAEVGWQLSFAAVAGIALWARPMRALLIDRLDAIPDRLAVPLAEGAALTIAATIATGPLMVHHFEAFSPASLPANLLVLPAVAPVMWLGMAAAMVGQVPVVPTAPVAPLEGPLLDYIAAVASALGRPEWALLRLPAGSAWVTVATYAGLIAGGYSLLPVLRRRAGIASPRPLRLALAAAALLALLPAALGRPGPAAEPISGLRIVQLDVGQGDAILLRSGSLAALVDTGPPGAGIATDLSRHGVQRLEAVFVTHDQLDHAGGLGDLAGRVPFGRLVLAGAAPRLESLAASAGAEVERAAEGSTYALGSVELTALWPAAGRAEAPAAGDPNASSLVLAVRHRGWRALLTGDAEAESTGLDPGPFDLLKVAHHGSADAGLDRLLDRSAPRVALIGVGAGNPHGHPSPGTLASLRERGICVLRTDTGGELWAELGPGGLRAGSERDPSACDTPGDEESGAARGSLGPGGAAGEDRGAN